MQGQLCFFDVLVYSRGDDSMDHKEYKKPTDLISLSELQCALSRSFSSDSSSTLEEVRENVSFCHFLVLLPPRLDVW